ncbi:TPA: hypothetical protein QDC03_005991, partial [Burkholderia cepacia]|nr:hypothetical protein [Burkholderia cepacia]
MALAIIGLIMIDANSTHPSIGHVRKSNASENHVASENSGVCRARGGEQRLMLNDRITPDPNSPFGNARDAVWSAMDKLQDTTSFIKYSEINGFHPDTMLISASGDLKIQKYGGTGEWVDLPKYSWYLEISSIRQSAGRIDGAIDRQRFDVPLNQMLSFYGVSHSGSMSSEEMDSAISELSNLADRNDSRDGIVVNFGGESWIPSPQEYDAMVSDFEKMKDLLAIKRKEFSPSDRAIHQSAVNSSPSNTKSTSEILEGRQCNDGADCIDAQVKQSKEEKGDPTQISENKDT